jgi:hypothetical protein
VEAIAEQVGTKARSTDVACSTDRYTATYVVAPSLEVHLIVGMRILRTFKRPSMRCLLPAARYSEVDPDRGTAGAAC